MVCLFVVMMGDRVLLPVLPFFLERIMSASTPPENITFHFGLLTAIYSVTLVFLVVPNLLALVSLKEPGSSGWALGMQSSFSGIGQIAGPLVGTTLYTLSPGSSFYITGGLLVATSFIGFQKLSKPAEN